MAFDATRIFLIAQSSYANLIVWGYRAPVGDLAAQVETAGYFGNLARTAKKNGLMMNVGDTIQVTFSPSAGVSGGTKAYSVMSINATTGAIAIGTGIIISA
jgi:hypothetical protein